MNYVILCILLNFIVESCTVDAQVASKLAVASKYYRDLEYKRRKNYKHSSGTRSMYYKGWGQDTPVIYDMDTTALNHRGECRCSSGAKSGRGWCVGTKQTNEHKVKGQTIRNAHVCD